MAPHSSVLAWRIPGTGEPGGLPSMGSHRVRHDWSDLAATAASHLCIDKFIFSLPVFIHSFLCAISHCSMDVVWVDSGSWWWTGRPGVLRFMGSQRVGHDWATELNWGDLVSFGQNGISEYLHIVFDSREKVEYMSVSTIMLKDGFSQMSFIIEMLFYA